MAEMDKNLEMAHGIKEKFELYLAGLAFTLLAFSIQTGKFDGASITAQVSELSGWGLLLISSFAGLFRLHYLGPILSMFAERNRLNQIEEQIKQHAASGQAKIPVDGETMSIEDALGKVHTRQEKNDAQAKRLEWWIIVGYQIHFYGLLLGICALVVSRALDPLRKILVQLC